MKNLQYFTLAMLSIGILTACEPNDTLDDAVIVGQMAPHIYWEIGSSTVKAGNNVPFTVQYYTTSESLVKHLEVWYNLMEEESKSAMCPWTQTFNFSMVSTKTAEKRIMQKIAEYPHRESTWNDSLRAYSFTAEFPTSNTLAGVSWIKPTTFDNDRMVSYFGANFAQQFKDSLYKRMKVTDFQKMLSGLNLVDNFRIYLDSTKNDNSGGWDYHFPKDAQGNTPVPQTIQDIYKNIPFQDLILNSATNLYEIEYSRTYSLKSQIRAIDTKGISGLSTDFSIILN